MDKIALKNKIRELEGLTNDEKTALLELLNKQKKYGLVWEDKPEDVEERLRDELPVLKEVKERFISSEDPEAPNHILIEGDNLEALTALTYTHAGKIDVIFISIDDNEQAQLKLLCDLHPYEANAHSILIDDNIMLSMAV